MIFSQPRTRSQFESEFARSSARSLVVSAPVGAGLGRLLEQYIVNSVRAANSVVVIVPMLVLLEQWRHRLQLQDVPVTALHGGSELLLALDRESLAHPGVLLLSAQLLVTREQTPAFVQLQPDLLVIDRVRAPREGKTADCLERLMQRAGRVVQAQDAVGPPPLLPVDQLIEYGLPDFAYESGGGCVVRVIEPKSDRAIEDLRHRAALILNDLDFLVPQVPSLAQLHSHIAKAAADCEEAAQIGKSGEDSRTIVQALNELLEQCEALEADPRATALIAAVIAAVEARRPCVVTVNQIVDGEYLMEVLREAGVRAAFASGTMESSSVDLANRALFEGGVLVRTRALTQSSALPMHTTHIWWDAPATSTMAQDLAVAIASGDVEIITFESDAAHAAVDLLRSDL